jgi:hypothetical protein
MKRTIIIIAFFVLLISIPILTEANDTLAVKLENPILQSEKVKLPWYKTLKYEFGYTGGACTGSRDILKPKKNYLSYYPDNLFNWLNSVNLNIFLPPNNRIAIGIKYGWFPHLTEREGLGMILYDENYNSIAGFHTDRWAIYYNSILLKYYKTKTFYYGVSINHFIANTEENYHSAINGILSDKTAIVQRKCIGGEIFCGLERHILLKKFEIIPFIKLQVGHAVEYHNNSPWEWGSKKLMIGTSGIFLGINIRVGGRR